MSWGFDYPPAGTLETNAYFGIDVSTNVFLGDDPNYVILLTGSTCSNSWSGADLDCSWQLMANTSHYVRVRCGATVTNTWVVRGAVGHGSIGYDLVTASMNISVTPSSHVSFTHDGIGISTGCHAIVFGEPFTVVHEAAITFEHAGTNQEVQGHAILQSEFSVSDVYDEWGSNVTQNVTITSIGPGLYPAAPDLNIRSTGDEVELWWHSLSNEVYDILTCSDLVEGAWSNASVGVGALPPLNTMPAGTNDSLSFFRLRTIKQ